MLAVSFENIQVTSVPELTHETIAEMFTYEVGQPFRLKGISVGKALRIAEVQKPETLAAFQIRYAQPGSNAYELHGNYVCVVVLNIAAE